MIQFMQKVKHLQNAHFYFYDIGEGKVLNYDMNNQVRNVSEIIDFKENSQNDLSYTFPKYQYKIFIKTTALLIKSKKILKNNIKQKWL
ncbi:MAG: hypothetical protein U5K55_03290 [Aliarcobacter sp.]|nr:hypothetical protein [Aliarcobacter sp.]